MEDNNILQVKDLEKKFPVRAGYIFSRKMGFIHAVDSVSFSMKKGETFGLVGESGCGKTTTGRIICRLIPADGGSVLFRGEEILNLEGEPLRRLRREIQIVFQDPLSSLNPRMSIFETLSEPLIVHDMSRGKELREKAACLLEEVELNSTFMDRFPHQLSGGQRQRVLIARALSLSPSFLVADEPVSAMDVSIQAQVINMLKDLQARKGFSCLFISHDLAVVRNISSRVGVMYLGKMVEIGPVDEIFESPLHPYTMGLLESVPDMSAPGEHKVIPGDIPDPLNLPQGCPFHPRCPKAKQICREETPKFREKGEGRWTACLLA